MHPKTTMSQSTTSVPEPRTRRPPKAPFTHAILKASPQADDIIKDSDVLCISAEDQLKLRALRIKNNHL
jgi:hypothetical protein